MAADLAARTAALSDMEAQIRVVTETYEALRDRQGSALEDLSFAVTEAREAASSPPPIPSNEGAADDAAAARAELAARNLTLGELDSQLKSLTATYEALKVYRFLFVCLCVGQCLGSLLSPLSLTHPYIHSPAERACPGPQRKGGLAAVVALLRGWRRP